MKWVTKHDVKLANTLQQRMGAHKSKDKQAGAAAEVGDHRLHCFFHQVGDAKCSGKKLLRSKPNRSLACVDVGKAAGKEGKVAAQALCIQGILRLV